MAEFIAVKVKKNKKIPNNCIRDFEHQKVAPLALQLKLVEFAALATIMRIKKFSEFIKKLSSNELTFLTLIIVKTNFGSVSDVVILSSEILDELGFSLPMIKKIRKKLIALEIIFVETKIVKRGHDFSSYSINPDIFQALFFEESNQQKAVPRLTLIKND